MFSIEKAVEVIGGEQVVCRAEHGVRMTLAEKGGRAIMRVLAKDAKVVSPAVVANASEVEASGRLIVSLACEIAGGEVVPLEYAGGFSFAHKANFLGVAVGADVSAIVSAVRVIRVAGCEVVCEVDVVFSENFSVMRSEKAIVSAVDCYSAVRKVRGVTAGLKVHDFVAMCDVSVAREVGTVLAAEFACEAVGAVFRNGSIVCSGDVRGFISYLDGAGQVFREVVTFPYREEFSVSSGVEFASFARAGESRVVCEVNEVRGVTAVSCEVDIEISVWGYTSAEYECGADFFSDKFELSSEVSEFVCSELVGTVGGSAKFSGVCELPFDLPTSVEVVSARVSRCDFDASRAVCDCEVSCTVSGDRKFCEAVVPFAIEFPIRGGDCGVCDVMISEIGARISGGAVEIFGKASGVVAVYATLAEAVVTEIFAGAEKAECTGGFVVYRGEAGESLLDVCESICIMPDLLIGQNPGVRFPLEADRKLVVWKKA